MVVLMVALTRAPVLCRTLTGATPPQGPTERVPAAAGSSTVNVAVIPRVFPGAPPNDAWPRATV